MIYAYEALLRWPQHLCVWGRLSVHLSRCYAALFSEQELLNPERRVDNGYLAASNFC